MADDLLQQTFLGLRGAVNFSGWGGGGGGGRGIMVYMGGGGGGRLWLYKSLFRRKKVDLTEDYETGGEG